MTLSFRRKKILCALLLLLLGVASFYVMRGGFHSNSISIHNPEEKVAEKKYDRETGAIGLLYTVETSIITDFLLEKDVSYEKEFKESVGNIINLKTQVENLDVPNTRREVHQVFEEEIAEKIEYALHAQNYYENREVNPDYAEEHRKKASIAMKKSEELFKDRVQLQFK